MLLLKGLRSRLALNEAIEQCRAVDPEGRVWLETDMRAHCNPTRMRSIRRLGLSLVRRLRTPCPACGSPGWGFLDTIRHALYRVPHAHCAHPCRTLGLPKLRGTS